MKKLILIFFLVFSGFIQAQELDATVITNMEQLQTASKDRLLDFKRAVGDYLNNTKFTERFWEWEKIKCTFNIFFVTATPEMRYSAQIVITSQRPIENTKNKILMLSILDNRWAFPYEPNQAMYFNPNEYNALTTLLDFYAFIIIGFDMDSYGPDPLGGSEIFNKAYELSNSASSTSGSDEWRLNSSSYNRKALISDITNEKFQEFREDFMDYHYNGVDVIFNDKKKAQKNVAKLIENIYKKYDTFNKRSVLLKVFFDAKNAEIAAMLEDYDDITIFDKVKRIDAGHITKYNEVLEKRENN